LEAADGWTWTSIETIPSRLGVDAQLKFSVLSGDRSGGLFWPALRSLSRVCCSWTSPPTTFDVVSMEWMESFLAGYPGNLFFIPRPCLSTGPGHPYRGTRPGSNLSYPGNYPNFLTFVAAYGFSDASLW
jgi:hypothetical protein